MIVGSTIATQKRYLFFFFLFFPSSCGSTGENYCTNGNKEFVRSVHMLMQTNESSRKKKCSWQHIFSNRIIYYYSTVLLCLGFVGGCFRILKKNERGFINQPNTNFTFKPSYIMGFFFDVCCGEGEEESKYYRGFVAVRILHTKWKIINLVGRKVLGFLVFFFSPLVWCVVGRISDHYSNCYCIGPCVVPIGDDAHTTNVKLHI